MDIEDIDVWYEESKERISENYFKQVRKNSKKIDGQVSKLNIRIPKDDDEKKKIAADKKVIFDKQIIDEKNLKKSYLDRMKKLHNDYDKRIKSRLDSDVKKHFSNIHLKLMIKKILRPITNMIEQYQFHHPKKEKK
jgi:hypothetical protein